MAPFQLPDPLAQQDHASNFDQECDGGDYSVNPVNHGEFEQAVAAVLKVAGEQDKGASYRCDSLAIQRCRRGGKTFMLAAVAAQLSSREDAAERLVVSISFNSKTPYETGEDAVAALCKRVAIALTGASPVAFHFRHKNPDDYVLPMVEWIESRDNLILLVDELNMIPPEAESYSTMSTMLDNLIDERAVRYSILPTVGILLIS